MASTSFKKPQTPEDQRKRDLGRIHMLKKQVMEKIAGFGEENYRDLIYKAGGCDSSADLDSAGRFKLIVRLSELAGEEMRKPNKPAWSKKNYPHRPKNMDKPGESRSDKLGKIEALLTIGKLSWAYADAIAKQMRLADKVQWVNTEDLFRIITALTKKAQREGWDLSGAK